MPTFSFFLQLLECVVHVPGGGIYTGFLHRGNKCLISFLRLNIQYFVCLKVVH